MSKHKNKVPQGITTGIRSARYVDVGVKSKNVFIEQVTETKMLNNYKVM